MKTKDIRAYWGFIRSLPCLVCYDAFYVWLLAQDPEVQDGILGMVDTLQDAPSAQRTPTEVAHLGMSGQPRGLAQRYPPHQVGPLCGDHHQLADDSHHAGTAAFWEKHPLLDRDALQVMLYSIWQRKPAEPTL